jgi:hypothetical protein
LARTRAIDLHKLGNQLLELIILEARQRGALGTGVETLAIAVRAEQTHLAIVATVDLHALKALGGIVENGGSGRNAEVSVRLHLRCLPTISSSPSHRDHVVSAVGVAQLLGRTRQGNISQVCGASDIELGAVKLGDVGCNGAHG